MLYTDIEDFFTSFISRLDYLFMVRKKLRAVFTMIKRKTHKGRFTRYVFFTLISLFATFNVLLFGISEGIDILITDFYSCDRLGNPQDYFPIKTTAYFNITIRNLAPDPKNVSIYLSVLDELEVPIGLDQLDITIPPDVCAYYIMSIFIPKMFHVGVATAYASVLVEGIAIGSESTEFYIGPIDLTPPVVHLLSPENVTYGIESVPLVFRVNERTDWMGYSLNNDKNVSIAGNTTLTSLANGLYSIRVYANDTSGNVGSSEKVHFTIMVVHDVAVINLNCSSVKVYLGQIANISVSVQNEGTVAETFNVTTFYDSDDIQTQTNVTLNPCSKTTLTFGWNTTCAPGNHIISAKASIVPGETDTADNTFVNGIIEVIARTNIPIKGGENVTIEGNVTISNAVTAKNTLHFDVSGPSGLTGWIKVTFPTINTTNIRVFISKGRLVPPPFPIITTNGTHYFIYLEFALSTHEITIQYAISNIAITKVISSKTVVAQRYPTNITIAVENRGDFTEDFNVTVYCNQTPMTLLDGKNYTTVTLTSGNSKIIIFTCNTNGFAKSNYTISAYAEPVLGETDTADNSLTDGWLVITVIGDINGDFKVDIKDLVLVHKYYASCLGHPTKPWNPNADVNSDGKVDIKDVVLVIKHFGEHYP